jgi:signal transduction histidine kinase
MPGGYLAFGDDGVITATNATLRAMLCYCAEELHGKPVETILTVPGRIFYQTHLFPLLKMQGHLNEVYLAARAKTGEEVPLLINAVRQEVDGRVSNECVAMAMRRRNEYEDEILKAKRAAESANAEKDEALNALAMAKEALLRNQEELRVRNCELERMRDTLEEQVLERTARVERQSKELQSFNYSIAHDFRAPLRALVSTSIMLLEESGQELSAEQKRLLGRQIYNARRLSRLVDDLLQFSRLSLVEPRPTPIDLSDIAKDASSAKHVLQEREDVNFHIQPGIRANADRSMIRVALDHLFQNAVKFSPKGGLVSFGERRVDGARAFFVRDEGIGLDMQYAEKIFQPFERLHLDEELSGTGIGLALVDRIISRHGGRIWVESEVGKGSTFLFTL